MISSDTISLSPVCQELIKYCDQLHSFTPHRTWKYIFPVGKKKLASKMLEKCTLSLLQVVDDLCYRWEDNSAADTCSETLELLMTHLCWAVDEPHQENTDQAPTYLGLTITSDHSMAGPWWNKSETRSWWSQVNLMCFLHMILIKKVLSCVSIQECQQTILAWRLCDGVEKVEFGIWDDD